MYACLYDTDHPGVQDFSQWQQSQSTDMRMAEARGSHPCSYPDTQTGDYLVTKLAAATTTDSPILHVSIC
jgi:hypothetical protein